ncbi:unnamed protein product [Lactuca saligna]|uniref:Uncharacterized protein n=1 Tax=Lactuca saligna TaxID=75948 RepID=A0AA36A699_LACSI|nr:unnamed protein product [Lactuca saligna]
MKNSKGEVDHGNLTIVVNVVVLWSSGGYLRVILASLPTGSALSSPHRFLATHIRISPNYRRDDADDHRPDSDLGSHDGIGIGYVPLSSSNPRISLMLPQSVLTTGLTPDLCHRQQPNSHRQLELLTPFRLLLKRCHHGFVLLKEMNLWLTMEATVKKFQQKFKRVKDDMDKWDNLHAQLVSPFRNASSIIGRLQLLESPKNYGSLKNLDNIKNNIFTKQMESLQKILLSMTKTLYSPLLTSPTLCQERRLKELQDKLEVVKMEQPQGHDER